MENFSIYAAQTFSSSVVVVRTLPLHADFLARTAGKKGMRILPKPDQTAQYKPTLAKTVREVNMKYLEEALNPRAKQLVIKLAERWHNRHQELAAQQSQPGE